jgi:ParB family transcriptional regulator, chromosome partitioning protein
MSAEKPRRLGRGLEALLTTRDAPTANAASAEGVQRIALGQIRPNPYQPRREFEPGELAELEASLKSNGLLQPVTVRRSGRDSYELIAGERRFRAAGNIGWTDIPAIIRDVDDRTMLTLALVENLQRADLNCVEEALGYQRLLQEFGLTQQQIAEAVGKDRSTIANFIRLLSLPEPVREMLEKNLLSMGHARAILGLPDDRARTDLANEAVAKGLSVRDLEHRVRMATEPAAESAATSPRAAVAAERSAQELPVALRGIQDQLRRLFQTDVSIALTGKEKGQLRVAFYSADDLDRILDLIMGQNRNDFQ